MAAIDSLLRVMSLRGAEAMIISTGQVPTLRRGGAAEPMAMPPIDPLMVRGFIDELAVGPARDALEERGSLEVTCAVGADHFAIAIERTTQGYRLLVRPTRAPRPSPTSAPPATAAPATTSPPLPPAVPTAARPTPPSPPPPAAPAPVVAPRAPIEDGPAAASTAAFDALIEHAGARQASDLLLTAGLAPRVRIDGELVELDERAPTDADLAAWVAAHGGAAATAELEGDGATDFAFTVGELRLRAHAFHHERGLALALRLLRTAVPTVTSLGLPEDLTSLISARAGLVLIAGPTGAGKSTTPGRPGRSPEPHPGPPRHHPRGSHRVLARAGPRADPPARDRTPRHQLRRRPARRPAREPRRAGGRRAARSRDHRDRPDRGRDRAPRPRHRPTPPAPAARSSA
jgi:Tfp pilus assembly pilus retraction ATPase PilT